MFVSTHAFLIVIHPLVHVFVSVRPIDRVTWNAETPSLTTVSFDSPLRDQLLENLIVWETFPKTFELQRYATGLVTKPVIYLVEEAFFLVGQEALVTLTHQNPKSEEPLKDGIVPKNRLIGSENVAQTEIFSLFG
ncbi:hypothetical protein TWF506_006074 [Arthrobotrys conoides]|uniref:Uncharacterized protein n=1 Tax=Arthrobotrys conoides TaxID=74498 RepID=A0AAN8NSR4_9PEZI